MDAASCLFLVYCTQIGQVCSIDNNEFFFHLRTGMEILFAVVSPSPPINDRHSPSVRNVRFAVPKQGHDIWLVVCLDSRARVTDLSIRIADVHARSLQPCVCLRRPEIGILCVMWVSEVLMSGSF